MSASPFDKAEFIATFKAEAEEHLTKLSQGLLSLEKNPDQPKVIEEIFRAAHTLKGAARMMEFGGIQEVAHRLEDLFGAIQQGRVSLSSPIADRAFVALDAIKAMLEAIAPGKPISADVSVVCQDLEACLAGSPPVEASTGPPKPPGPQPTISEESKVGTTSNESRAAGPEVRHSPEGAQPALQLEEYIRIPIGRVNELLNLVGELVVNKVKSTYKLTALRHLTKAAKTSQKRLAQLAEQARGRMDLSPGRNGELSGLLHQSNLDAEALTREILALADRLSAEAVHLDPVIDELQFKVRQLRMLPCATIFEGFERLVRDVAKDQQKEVTLVIQGQETELDKKVLEATKPCLIHLLRNAVFHGIEQPDERKAQGKPTVGTIWLRASEQGAKVVIEVQDDGGGIDLGRVKQVLLKQRIMAEDELNQMGEPELVNLIFAPGFTTSPSITDISGRGVGLDVVRTEIERLRGRVHVASRWGEGTTVTIELPLTVAIMQVLLVEAEGKRFGLPLASVEEIVAVRPQAVQSVEHRMGMIFRDQTVPLVRLAEVLSLAGKPVDEGIARPKAAEEWPVVILSSLERRVGFLVDRVVGEEEIFIKSLGSHLGKLKNVSGATILGTGEVLVILDVADLMLSARLAQPAIRPKEVALEKPKRRILVVEDSLMTRELERSILEGQGYDVKTAVDGIDALESLRQDDFHLVVCDVEMPRMGGFEFCKALRQRPEHQEIPVIFVTGLGKDEERSRGIEVGAQAYIVKSGFEQTDLLQSIERFIG